MNAEQWMRTWHSAERRYDALCMGIMHAIADGKDLDEVLDLVGDSMNNCDHVDDESIALFGKAKAAIAPSPPESNT